MSVQGYEDVDEGEDIDLKSLCGLRTLTGISRETVEVDWIGSKESVLQVVLQLDGILYEFTEEPNDGYRSSLGTVRSVRMTAHKLAPVDPPLVVQVNHRTRGEYTAANDSDAIYMIDERTGLVVLDIGTDNIHDYYPSFVFSWNPEGWTPEWLKAKDTGVIVRDKAGKPWVVVADFGSHAEAKACADQEKRRVLHPRDVAVRLSKKTMRFEVHKRASDAE